ISLSEKLFLFGIASFAMGHLGYLATFLVRGQQTQTGPTLFALPPTLIISALITGYLWNKIPKLLRPAVLGYVVLISGLVIAAWRLSSGPGGTLLFVGAIAFYISDISVALDRFVQRKFIYRLWGLPLYYAAQVLLIVGLVG
ncbi:MAG: lysoplasmalogenase, partial [Bdellovibrionales bacterium]|nr:lysoplasmalogenase [Bdellovibrionales bacterium]